METLCRTPRNNTPAPLQSFHNFRLFHRWEIRHSRRGFPRIYNYNIIDLKNLMPDEGLCLKKHRWDKNPRYVNASKRTG